MKNLILSLLLWGLMGMSLMAYTLSTKNEMYVPIGIDDITTMIPLHPSVLVSPHNGAKLTSSTLVLMFSKGSGVDKRYLKIWYKDGKEELTSAWIIRDRFAIGGLPEDGKYIIIELYSYIGQTYFVKRYKLYAALHPSIITSPSSNSHLNSGVMTLRWSNGEDVTQRYMTIGTTGYNSSNVFKGYLSGNRKTFYNLPKNGETIYVTLRSRINNKWEYKYYKYTATDVKPMAKKFVKAYLAGHNNTMKNIAPQRVINKLKTKNTLVKSYFKKIKTYSKLLYFHDYNALVIAKMSDNKELKFNFVWDGSRWVLESVI